MKPYSVPFHIKLFRFIFKPAFRLLFLIIAKINISGKENIPQKGPYMVAMNHISLYDPPFMIALWPQMLEAMGASDIWKKKGQNILAKYYGGIQVHRGEFDRELIETVINVLRSGYPLLIAPEGGRSHKPGLCQAKAGIAFILDEANVPIIPVGIIGTTDDFAARAFSFKRPKLEMHIGRPIILPSIEGRGQDRRIARQNNADLVMRHIAGLLPPDYRGIYSDSVILPE
jgi:1-acyl-sn-glycerol-3-phosphate acyltransferase